MSLFNRTIVGILLLAGHLLSAQDCHLSLTGRVIDHGNGEALEFVNVYIQGADRGAVTDSTGGFRIDHLCPDDYHIVFSHIGCEVRDIFIEFRSDTTIITEMDHSSHVLEGVVVSETNAPRTTQNAQAIGEQVIYDNASENLANLLQDMTGVSVLKNGNSIAKPIVHGLFGNRLSILNNGVAQSGQQWGNDHSPEIDALVANQIRVIKGVGALAYPGSNLGSIILVEPKKIEREPHLHGKVSYFYETNGRAHGLNVQMQQYAPSLAWKVNGTIKRGGDRKTADYYLTNTGSAEANLAIQLEKELSERLFVDAYISTFNTELGVLRGSHIGNLTDLEDAFSRDVPLYTEEHFSYTIEAPSQKVNHHLMKLHAKQFVNDNNWLDYTIAAQLNDRKEFDVRRSGRSELPALSLRQYTLFGQVKYHKELSNNLNIHTGVQLNIIDNTNDPETGILPLIPDYLAYESGLFMILNKQVNKSNLEMGIRYDNVRQNVVTITTTTPKEVVRYDNNFNNYSGSFGWTYEANDHFNVSYNLGLASRSPAINELYSGGLHQGVSGIEEGNIDLQTEKAVKTTFGININLNEEVAIEALAYYQRFDNYIYLSPQDETRLTIRGAFPVFRYEQTDARIFGLDLSTNVHLSETLHAKLGYSYLRGDDLTEDQPLVNMPANNVTGSLAYEFAKPWTIGSTQINNVEYAIELKHVFRQNHLFAEQDYVLTPDAYQLVGMKLAGDLQLKQNRVRIVAKVDNLLNVAYRDYLNRLRYFADDQGINVSLGVSVKF